MMRLEHKDIFCAETQYKKKSNLTIQNQITGQGIAIIVRSYAFKDLLTSLLLVNTGVKLLINNHQNISNEVKGQLGELTDKRMIHKDASVAETCLIKVHI